jgi:hypothetical protein
MIFLSNHPYSVEELRPQILERSTQCTIALVEEMVEEKGSRLLVVLAPNVIPASSPIRCA